MVRSRSTEAAAPGPAATPTASAAKPAVAALRTGSKSSDPAASPSEADPTADPTTPTTLATAISAVARPSGGNASSSDGRTTSDPAVTQAAAPADGSNALAAQSATPAATAAAADQTAANTGPGPAINGQIAAQIAAKVSDKSTRFDVSLNPGGLGRVDVQVHIDAAGQVSASLSFSNAQSAADARAHAADLQQALEQAGFNVPQGGLSFDVGGHGASFAQQQQQNSNGQTSAGAAAAFANTSPDSALPAATAYRAASGASGLDITI